MRRTFPKLFITACLIALAAAGPSFATNGMYLTRLQTSLRLGWWWRADPRLSFGAIYQTETKSRFDGGDMTINFNAHPQLGRKVHYDATLDGFTFAAQAGAGVAFRPSPDWVLALDVKRCELPQAPSGLQEAHPDRPPLPRRRERHERPAPLAGAEPPRHAAPRANPGGPGSGTAAEVKAGEHRDESVLWRRTDSATCVPPRGDRPALIPYTAPVPSNHGRSAHQGVTSMKKNKNLKLSLNRETLRALADNQTAHVDGGQPTKNTCQYTLCGSCGIACTIDC
jgi:hypothetical protein